MVSPALVPYRHGTCLYPALTSRGPVQVSGFCTRQWDSGEVSQPLARGRQFRYAPQGRSRSPGGIKPTLLGAGAAQLYPFPTPLTVIWIHCSPQLGCTAGIPPKTPLHCPQSSSQASGEEPSHTSPFDLSLFSKNRALYLNSMGWMPASIRVLFKHDVNTEQSEINMDMWGLQTGLSVL